MKIDKCLACPKPDCDDCKEKKAKGYSWAKRVKKWRACIRANGKNKHLGYYKTESEARAAYLQAKKNL